MLILSPYSMNAVVQSVTKQWPRFDFTKFDVPDPTEEAGVTWRMFKTIPRGIGVDVQSTRSPLEAMGWISHWETADPIGSANRCGDLWALGGFAKFGPKA